MTDYIKKTIDRYREKTERPSRSEFVIFRVTPEERDLLYSVYGSPIGIRDFALASTDTNTLEDILKVEDEDTQA